MTAAAFDVAEYIPKAEEATTTTKTVEVILSEEGVTPRFAIVALKRIGVKAILKNEEEEEGKHTVLVTVEVDEIDVIIGMTRALEIERDKIVNAISGLGIKVVAVAVG